MLPDVPVLLHRQYLFLRREAVTVAPMPGNQSSASSSASCMNSSSKLAVASGLYPISPGQRWSFRRPLGCGRKVTWCHHGKGAKGSDPSSCPTGTRGLTPLPLFRGDTIYLVRIAQIVRLLASSCVSLPLLKP